MWIVDFFIIFCLLLSFSIILLLLLYQLVS